MSKIAKTHIHTMSWVRPSTTEVLEMFFEIPKFYHKLDIHTVSHLHEQNR